MYRLSQIPGFGRALKICLIGLACGLLPAYEGHAAVTIDIHLVYDNTATAWIDTNSNLDTFSQDAVNRMNLAMQNSGVNLVFRLVHAMTVDYTTTSGPSSTLSGDLEALQRGDGALAQAHVARETYGADLVAMLVDTQTITGYVGIGYMLNTWAGQPAYAFTVSAIQSVDIGHILTHEVGHNLGAHHSKFQYQYPGPNRYLDNQYSAG